MSTNVYPVLRFQLNKALDVHMANQFLDVQAGGIDFGDNIIRLYPKLKPAKTETGNQRQEIIKNFTDKYYQEHLTDLNSILKTIRTEWLRLSKQFYQLQVVKQKYP